MSRHKISRKGKRGTVICGYDRPLDEFFGQVWSKRGNMIESWSLRNLDDLLENIERNAGVLPTELRQWLLDESQGVRNPGIIVDWTTDPITEHVL